MQASDEVDISEILPESIETGLEYLPGLINGMDKVATLFRQGHLGEANQLFCSALEGFGWFLTVIDSIYRVPQLSEGIKGYSEKLEDFRKAMENLMEAYSSQDVILMADIIEFELLENLEYWLECFGRLASILSRN